MHSSISKFFFALMLIFSVGACGGSTETPAIADAGNSQKDDGASIATTATDGSAKKNDITPGTTTNCTSNGRVTYVINKFTMPSSKDDMTADIDGDGDKENGLGGLIPMAKIAGQDPQKNIDQMVSSGSLLFILDLNTQSVDNADPITISAYGATDADSDITNNFSGSAEMTKSTANPSTIPTLNGKISNTQLSAGPGEALAPVPMGTTPVIIAVKGAYVKGKLTCGGIEDGQINGALAFSDLIKVMPEIAMYEKLLVDLDMDKDGKKESLSFGMGFTAVRCIIK